MPAEPPLPKYTVIVDAVRSRIAQGVYPVGEMLPSEAQLVREFGASRGTVVRALESLRQQGWLTGVQGKGRVVLGRPAAAAPAAPDRIRGVLDTAETSGVALLSVGPTTAPNSIASVLALPAAAPLLARQRGIGGDRATPTALTVVYAATGLARSTGLDQDSPMRDGLLRRLHRRGVVAHHVVERIGARAPNRYEAALLRADQRGCLVTLLLVVRDQAGRPLLAVDSAFPARHPLLDASFGIA